MALGPGIPNPQANSPVSLSSERHRISEKLRVIANSVLGGLHHNYELAVPPKYPSDLILLHLFMDSS